MPLGSTEILPTGGDGKFTRRSLAGRRTCVEQSVGDRRRSPSPSTASTSRGRAGRWDTSRPSGRMWTRRWLGVKKARADFTGSEVKTLFLRHGDGRGSHRRGCVRGGSTCARERRSRCRRKLFTASAADAFKANAVAKILRGEGRRRTLIPVDRSFARSRMAGSPNDCSESNKKSGRCGRGSFAGAAEHRPARRRPFRHRNRRSGDGRESSQRPSD